MVQIVTVSANTAAFAMEAYKQPQRLPRAKFVEETVRLFEADDREVDSVAAMPLVDVARSSSTGLSMLGTGDHPPQATIQEAIEAYREASS